MEKKNRCIFYFKKLIKYFCYKMVSFLGLFIKNKIFSTNSKFTPKFSFVTYLFQNDSVVKKKKKIKISKKMIFN